MPRSRSAATGITALRGAITVPENSAAAIRSATARLLRAMVETNRLEVTQIVSAVFTATHDLDADFPAHAARHIGWDDVPLLGAQEMPVPGALARVVRVLLTVSGTPAGKRLAPVYLDGAAKLRPDLTGGAIDGRANGAKGVKENRELTAGDTPERRLASEGARVGAHRRIALIGLGQIGGSIGLALARRRSSWHRVGFDLDPIAGRAALHGGALDELAPDLASACAGAELAVLATPVDTLTGLIEAATRALPAGAALLDTGSARGPVTRALGWAAAHGIRAVGGHPIAGNEGRGFASARATLFDQAPFALCPARGQVPAVITALLRDLGARALQVEPATHDRALARTSHLPYLLACALDDLGEGAARLGLSGPGFRDMTRLAASDPRVAEAYCRANVREIADAWRALREQLDKRVAALSNGG